jgi:predicted transcriptional regulator
LNCGKKWEELVLLLKQAKHERSLTMREIAERSQVGLRTVNRIFAGEDVRCSSLSAVMETLDIDPAFHYRVKHVEEESTKRSMFDA